MPHDLDLILTITGGLTAALLFGFVTQRLRLSPIVGVGLSGFRDPYCERDQSILLILARTHYVADVAALRLAGANGVVSGEREVALAMTEHLLEQLGATRDQLDRARDRARAEVKG